MYYNEMLTYLSGDMQAAEALPKTPITLDYVLKACTLLDEIFDPFHAKLLDICTLILYQVIPNTLRNIFYRFFRLFQGYFSPYKVQHIMQLEGFVENIPKLKNRRSYSSDKNICLLHKYLRLTHSLGSHELYL